VSESIWKKEIHLRRKKQPKQPKQSKQLKQPKPPAEPSVQSQSIWKKEIHLGRRKPAPTAPTPLATPEAKAARVVSAWAARTAEPPAPPAHLPEFGAPEPVLVPVSPAPAQDEVPEPPAEPASPPVSASPPSAVEPYGFAATGGAADPPGSTWPAAQSAFTPPPAPEAVVEPEPPAAFEPFVPHDPPAAPDEPAETVTSTWPPASSAFSPLPVEPFAPELTASFEAPAEPEPPAWPPRPSAFAPSPVEPLAPEPPVTFEQPLTFEAPATYERHTPEPPATFEAPVEAEPPVSFEQPATFEPPAEKPPAVEAPGVPFATEELTVPEASVPVELDEPARPKPEKEPRGRKKQPKQKKKGHDATRIVGLRIGSTKVAAAHVANNGSAELVQLAQAPLERGLVIGGEVRDADGLARELKHFFAANKLPRKGIRLGIASNRIGVRLLEVPTVDDPKQFENAIRFRAQELLPIPVTDAILDHVRLGETAGEGGEPLTQVLLVFAHRELVGRYVDVCRTAGLRLSGIDLEAFALLRALAEPRAEGEEAQHAVVAVAIGHDRTILAVSDGRICSLTRVLEWGSAQLDVAIARTLDLTPSQAEPIKLAFSLGGTEPPEGISHVQLEAVRSAVQSEIGVLGRELVSSLRFYQARPDSLAIGEVLLSGGGSQLDGLAAELQRLLGAPVRTADPFSRVELARKVTVPEQAGAFAIAVGLGIQD
jgi:type IV pilus assembly protein PilM